jgi:hypothetical protein
MGKQLRGPSSHHIRPRAPVHLLPVGHPVRPSQHPARSDDSIPPAVDGRTLLPPSQGHALCPLCRNELDRPPTVGPARPPRVARVDENTIPTQAVFGSPLILPGQFLDSPELPSEKFLEQFSTTLRAAEHSSTGHNTAAAQRPPPQLQTP